MIVIKRTTIAEKAVGIQAKHAATKEKKLVTRLGAIVLITHHLQTARNDASGKRESNNSRELRSREHDRSDQIAEEAHDVSNLIQHINLREEQE